MPRTAPEDAEDTENAENGEIGKNNGEKPTCPQCGRRILHRPYRPRLDLSCTEEWFCDERCEQRYFEEFGFVRCEAVRRGILPELQKLRSLHFDGVTVFRLYALIVARFFKSLTDQNALVR